MPLEYYVIIEYHKIEGKILFSSFMINHATGSECIGIKKTMNVSERIRIGENIYIYINI